MEKQNEPLKTLTEIRSMMERSSRFMSLSGLSGVLAGIFAIAGVAAMYWSFGLNFFGPIQMHNPMHNSPIEVRYIFIFVDFSAVLLFSLVAAIWLSWRKTRKHKLHFWDATAKRMVSSLFIPLAAGGVFCMAMYYNHSYNYIAPATIIFYGLALLNASKYTWHDIRLMGIIEIVIGLFASFFPRYAMIFWALAFGVLHLIYGTAMYLKYER